MPVTRGKSYIIPYAWQVWWQAGKDGKRAIPPTDAQKLSGQEQKIIRDAEKVIKHEATMMLDEDEQEQKSFNTLIGSAKTRIAVLKGQMDSHLGAETVLKELQKEYTDLSKKADTHISRGPLKLVLYAVDFFIMVAELFIASIVFQQIMETTTKSYVAAALVACVLLGSAFALGRQIGQGQGRSVWSWLLGVVPVLVILLVAWLRASYFQAEGLSELKGAAAFDANFLLFALLSIAGFVLTTWISKEMNDKEVMNYIKKENDLKKWRGSKENMISALYADQLALENIQDARQSDLDEYVASARRWESDAEDYIYRYRRRNTVKRKKKNSSPPEYFQKKLEEMKEHIVQIDLRLVCMTCFYEVKLDSAEMSKSDKKCPTKDCKGVLIQKELIIKPEEYEVCRNRIKADELRLRALNIDIDQVCKDASSYPSNGDAADQTK